jgi:RND family efflux transporter MFP subunit
MLLGHRTFLALLLTLMLAGTGCGHREAPPVPPPPSVTVATPVRRDVTEYHEYTGTVASVHSVEIRARVQGFLEQMHFEAGADVTKGALLFTIEQRPYQIAVSDATAALEGTQAALENARHDRDLVLEAFAKGAATDLERNDAETAAAERKAEADAAAAKLDQARLDLAYTEVRSPIAGRAGRNLVDPGDLVGDGEPTLLTTVVQMDPIWVYFDASDRILLQHGPRDRGKDGPGAPLPVEVSLSREATDGYPFKGHVDFIDNTVDPDTGTITMRGVFDNANGRLYPGLFARVRVPFRTLSNALLVQEDAIGTDFSGKYLLMVGTGDVVEKRSIEIGPREGELRVVLKGIGPDERYVVTGLQAARPGRAVRVESPG